MSITDSNPPLLLLFFVKDMYDKVQGTNLFKNFSHIEFLKILQARHFWKKWLLPGTRNFSLKSFTLLDNYPQWNKILHTITLLNLSQETFLSTQELVNCFPDNRSLFSRVCLSKTFSSSKSKYKKVFFDFAYSWNLFI